MDYYHYYQYAASVKEAFRNKPEKFAEFINILMEAKDKRINEASAIARIVELMKGHQNLLIGFNELCPEAEAKKMPYYAALAFINKVKARFGSVDTDAYYSILLIMNNFKEGNKSLKEVQEEVSALLYDHEDLLKEFNDFLP